jgi:hypothetical protein
MFKAILSEQRHHLEKSLFPYRALKYALKRISITLSFSVMSRVIFIHVIRKRKWGLISPM